MKVKDAVYGCCSIEEPVLVELINSKSIQRLKGIAQYGLPDDLYAMKGFSRYTHSVGVMILLKKMGAGLEEQIAGLTHDASHTAFSHLIDLVLGNREKEDFQDNNHEKFILNSEIPGILSKNGIDTGRVIDVHKFGLLEREAPDLCADRIDYALRDFVFDRGAVRPCLDNLTAYDGKLIFASEKAAEKFGFGYMKCQMEHWSGPEPKIRWNLFAQALRIALDNGIVSKEDFYETDSYVISKLKKSKNAEILGLLKTLSGKIKYEFVEENPQIYSRNKWRFVDPEYVEEGVVYRLSEVSAEYRGLLKSMKTKHDKGIKVNLLD
jgi:HD superfamily phosphohydrolase